MQLNQLNTPCALIDRSRMNNNIVRMQRHMDELGVHFRPHVKTSKCLPVVQEQIKAGAKGITVSTLKEAEMFFAAGITDILYAVCISAQKLPRVLAMRRQGCNLKVIVDSEQAAQLVCEFGREHGETFDVWIEVDTDGHRAGINPAGDQLLRVASVLHEGGMLIGGVLTHAGSSYELREHDKLVALAEQERAGCVLAAERLREKGFPCENVSVGSTPTAFAAEKLEGVTEVRAGVYVFFDLVMHNVGVCRQEDLALSILTTVIGHQPEKGWVLVDAGWMAVSRDRGTAKQHHDFGYGLACAEDGKPLDGFTMTGANQEHGIIARDEGLAAVDVTTLFPLGTRLRILPNHACATGAQHSVFHAVDEHGVAVEWPRFQGW